MGVLAEGWPANDGCCQPVTGGSDDKVVDPGTVPAALVVSLVVSPVMSMVVSLVVSLVLPVLVSSPRAVGSDHRGWESAGKVLGNCWESAGGGNSFGVGGGGGGGRDGQVLLIT